MGYELPAPNYEYITTTEHAQQSLFEIDKYDLLEVDTEGTGLDPLSDKTVLLQIGAGSKSWVFDVREGNVDPSVFKPILEGTDKLKLLQNARYDYQMLKTNFGISLRRMYDTMLAEQLLHLGLKPKANLQFLVKKYLGMDMPKDIATSFQRYNQEYQEYQLRYAANDVCGCLREIYNQQLSRLKQDGLMRAAKLEFDFLIPLSEMELRGITLDEAKWRGIINDHEIEHARLKQEVSKLFDVQENQTTLFDVSLVNIDSPSQIVSRLQSMGIPVVSSDVKELNKYKKEPIVKALLEYRKHAKFISTYGEALLAKIHPYTGRLHTDFQQMVDTGRLSSRNPNLQNIPHDKKYRACFVAKPGYKLVTCDMSGAELRIIADMSGEPKWIDIFTSGKDLHSVSAAGIFKVTEEEVARDKALPDDDPNRKDYRGKSKPLSFGLAYGLTAVGLSLRLGNTQEESQVMIDNYFATYPRVKEFLEKSGKSAVMNRYSMSNSGRRRYYTLPPSSDPMFGKIKGSVERQGKNMPIQAGNADTIKQAMIFVEERLKPYDAELILTVHDEVVVEVRADQAEEVAPIVSQSLVDGFGEFFKTVPMEADAMIGDCWLKG